VANDGAEMILIPEGVFVLGSNEGKEEERPEREIYLGPYYIDRYTVTKNMYQRFVIEAGYPAPPHWWEPSETGGLYYPREQGHHPVVNVVYEDARAYCQWSGKRLPTEAEWEKAARSADRRRYPWGDEWKEGTANFGFTETRPVTSFPSGQSPYGVCNMLGNVWEWVMDWYAPDAYKRLEQKNPDGASHGEYRGVRGGSHADPPGSVTVTTRGYRPPELPGLSLGFRCAQEVLQKPNK